MSAKGVLEGVLGGVTGQIRNVSWEKYRSHIEGHTEVTLAGTFPCIMSRVACCSNLSSFGPNEISVRIQLTSWTPPLSFHRCAAPARLST